MRLIAILLLSTLAFGQELLRPRVDSDPGNVGTYGCTGTVSHANSGMSLSYDAAGQSTSSNLVVSGVKTTAKGVTSSVGHHLFKSWQTTTGTYSSLTLNVSSASGGYIFPDGIANACIAYTIDSGAHWTSIRCDSGGTGWAKITNSVTLSASQALSTIQVGICAQGSNQNGFIGFGGDNIQLFDVWTLGATSGQSGGTGSSTGQAHRGLVIVN